MIDSIMKINHEKTIIMIKLNYSVIFLTVNGLYCLLREIKLDHEI